MGRKFQILVIANLLAIVAYSQSPKFGALAVDRSNGFYFGWAAGYQTVAEAEQFAVDACRKRGGSCSVVLTYSGKGCAAYRTIDGNVGTAYGWAVATTKEEADNAAIKECMKRSNGVYPSNSVWSCNDDTGTLKVIQNAMSMSEGSYDEAKKLILERLSQHASSASGRGISKEITKWSDGFVGIHNYSYSDFKLVDCTLSYKEENSNSAIAHTITVQIDLGDVISVEVFDKTSERTSEKGIDFTTDYPEGIVITVSTNSINTQDHVKSKRIDKTYEGTRPYVRLYGSFITESNIANQLLKAFKDICLR